MSVEMFKQGTPVQPMVRRDGLAMDQVFSQLGSIPDRTTAGGETVGSHGLKFVLIS